MMIVACTANNPAVRAHLTFAEVQQIAQQKEQPFCVVLTDSAQELSNEYIQLLKGEYGYLAKKAVFTVLDIRDEESARYIKWLTPVSLPLACVFSPDGQLIDLIPGAAKESFLYTNEAITNRHITAYHWPNRFQKNKQAVVPFLNQAWTFSHSIDQGDFKWKKYVPLADTLQYPYIEYLLFKAALLSQDSTYSLRNAQRLLSWEASGTLALYKDEFIAAKKVVDPDFSLAKAPRIRTEKESITLSNLNIGQDVPIDIVLHNDGEEPLHIEQINMSCSCVRLEGPDEGIVIHGKKSNTARFYFKPEDQGDLTRDIFISSNALNQPNLHINILAHVNP
ncbi:DUF1573 domain-containing protein [Sphingobacterium griseoflavum]|uniref:DUF1573 domain-containing protein n=1 Tax=Sphingobacterium griseoflavum TaxID=1474952 RepID=A0ABQ3HVY8_9SPHI|nr:DUF1573 domain-containing protein [Sphingobacterium griseoflavum]GHE36963.1 hypothetical protein GCM10017764_20220 [Sphingobacterium griseoflavum]